jgi:cytochrome bd-type quinol oxidase subunit 2
MRPAARSGFGPLVVGLAVGGVMIGSGVTEARTGNAQLAYSAISTLNPVHGVALHAILVLPALAWALGRTSSSERRRVRAVAAAAVAHAVLAVAVAVFTGL